MNSTIQKFGVVALSAAILASGAGSTAAEAASTTRSVAITTGSSSEEAVAEATMDTAPRGVAESTAEVDVASDGTTVTELPDGSTIEVSPEDAGITISGGDAPSVGISARMPDGAEAQVVDGTTVFDLGDHAVTYQPVAEDAGGGIRTVFTLAGPDSPTTFKVDYDLPAGARFVADEGNSFRVVDASGEEIGAIAAPWAKDAAGNAVPTSYELRGDTLIQRVDPGAETVWPVVADPAWIPAWAVVQIIRCGFGGWIGWFASAGWKWWQRAVSVIGGCLLGMR